MRENEPSSTALTVAMGMLFNARRADRHGLVSEEDAAAYRCFLEACGGGRRRLRTLGNPIAPWFVRAAEAMLLPGISLHYGLRKRFIGDQVVAALEAGAQQVVNLGAGFDALALRLHRQYPDVRFIEIDHPATQAVKRNAIGALDAHSNLQLLPVDFTRQTLQERLGSFDAFEPDRRTVYVLEGVAMYLTEEEVLSLLADLRALSGTPTLVFSFLEPQGSPDQNVGPLLSLYLRTQGEGLAWRIQRTQLRDFLDGGAYGLDHVATGHDLRQAYAPPSYRGPIHHGELLAVAKAR